MKPENIVFAVAGALFGLIAGWVIGTQQVPVRPAAAAMAVAADAAPAQAAAPATKPVLDESQVAALRTIADRDPANAESRVQLGNLYFDAERYADAMKWYEQAIAIAPKDANVSTDLAVSYYYTNQIDKALAQFDHSLSIDPKHAKTLLNMGVVKAFGKQDLAGAAAAWEQVLTVAPGSQEAEAAKRALDNLNAAHPGGTPVPPSAQKPSGN